MTEELDTILDGQRQWTDDVVFENCSHIVKATAEVHFVVIDKDTNEVLKDYHQIQFALVAADDSDMMDLKEAE